MDVGTLRKVLKRYGHWRRLQDHITMLSESEGPPIGRALTNEEQKRLLETAAGNPEWEHVQLRGGRRGEHIDARGRGEARPPQGRGS